MKSLKLQKSSKESNNRERHNISKSGSCFLNQIDIASAHISFPYKSIFT